jgi:probable addiction module antidote protein
MGTVTKTRKPAKTARAAKAIKPTKTKKTVTFSDWDPADDIETKEDVISLLEVTLEENDPDFLLSVIGDIARSKGMTQIAREMNLDRKGLYKSLAPDGNPSFKTVFKLLDILGFRITLEQKSA